MNSDAPLYQRDPEAWHALLAEGNAAQARKRVSADVIFRDRAGRILLVDPKYEPVWDLPGGMAEANSWGRRGNTHFKDNKWYKNSDPPSRQIKVLHFGPREVALTEQDCAARILLDSSVDVLAGKVDAIEIWLLCGRAVRNHVPPVDMDSLESLMVQTMPDATEDQVSVT